MIIFYEKLGFISFLKERRKNGVVYYCIRSVPLKMIDTIARQLSIDLIKEIKFVKIGWGDTHHLEDCLKNACENSISTAQDYFQWTKEKLKIYQNLFGIDFPFILKKYLIAQYLHEKYFSYELFMQYIKENPDEEYAMHIDKDFAKCYVKPLSDRCRLKYLTSFKWLEYITAIVAILVEHFTHLKIRVLNDPVLYKGSIICLVSDPGDYECYKELFEKNENVKFVTNELYHNYFKDKPDQDIIVHKRFVSSVEYKRIRKHTFRYVSMLIKERANLVCLGFQTLKFYHQIIMSRADTPEGHGNIFVVYEHHDFMKTIRNEFIRHDGNQIVYFPYLPGFALKYYPQEYYPQYDYILSSGKYLEDRFYETGAINPVFLKSGCFTTNKQGNITENDRRRIRELKKKKAGSLTITILCPGVCKPTYYSEVKLMELARRIADETKAKVFIRQKPFIPEPEYQGFYESFVNGQDSMHLTGMEYKLFDFTHVTDLFITTYSTSACEIALCGGSIYFVDYMKHPDRFIFWENGVSDGILLEGDQAFDEISAWINDRPDGSVRSAHKKAMERFVQYIGYIFPDYESYKKNLLSQLEENVFKDISRKTARN